MLSQESLSVLQSIIISGAGMLVVVIELAVLALAILLFTRLITLFGNNDISIERGNTANPQESIKEQDHAIVLAVVSDCLQTAGEQYQITSVREV